MLDIEVWEPSVITLFQSLGNTFSNSLWEELLQSGSFFQPDNIPKDPKSDKDLQLPIRKPSHFDHISIKEKFIYAKQQEKLFILKLKEIQHQRSSLQHMWDSVCSSDKKAVYRHIVNSEVDVNALHQQAAFSMSPTPPKVTVLLKRSLDQRGHTPLHHSTLTLSEEKT